ncbi:MAG: TatD family hydrolase [Omnitrophica bacterium]|nr:TatD family hydrolase [Candidatus Omnitrophota bacterium]
MIIDTHCHLDFEQFASDRKDTISQAEKAGVLYFINVGASLHGSRESVRLAAEYKNIFASVGIHPHHATGDTEGALGEIEALAAGKKVVAIGEVGLDYYKSPSLPPVQKKLFVKFIGLSRRLGLPLIIHNRSADCDTLSILKSECAGPVHGVLHCFSGERTFLTKALDMGLFISFTCNLTFKNAGNLREVAKYVPLDRVLLETDAPFLAPQAKRGKRNEPAYITELRDGLSEILGISKDEVEKVTSENAKKLFKLNI